MPTGFAINDFMSSVEGMGGLARRWKYSIQITPPIHVKKDMELWFQVLLLD